MFKRMQKLGDKLEKERKNGMTVEDQGPPEMVLDDDSDSDSSEDSSEGESESEDGAEAEGKGEGSSGSGSGSGSDEGKPKKSASAKKAKAENGDGGSEEDDSSSSSAADEADDAPPCSIEKALEDPIFVHPRATSKGGFKNRSCYLCPVAVLKTEKAILTHLGGGSHARRRKRFDEYCKKKLSVEEAKDPKEGGLDARIVVERIDKGMEVKAEKQAKHRQGIKLQMKEAKHRRMTEKVERRKKQKAAKLEKKANLLAAQTERQNAPKNGTTEGMAGEDKVAKVKVHAPKKKKVKYEKKVLPPKAERKARKKEKKEVKMAARKEAARLKAKEGAAKNKAAKEAAQQQS